MHLETCSDAALSSSYLLFRQSLMNGFDKKIVQDYSRYIEIFIFVDRKGTFSRKAIAGADVTHISFNHLFLTFSEKFTESSQKFKLECLKKIIVDMRRRSFVLETLCIHFSSSSYFMMNDLDLRCEERKTF